ncbi:Disks large-associated protein 5 [Armadillidium vulgare]|nr:Disks large-associated protein 5 [Armadillidium vulgare]
MNNKYEYMYTKVSEVWKLRKNTYFVYFVNAYFSILRLKMQSTSVNHDEFRNFITEQTCYLRMACENLKKDMEESTDIPEDLIGDVNVIFASLIDDSEFKRSEKEITLEDLQGFWDIVMIQIEKITQKIDDLKQLKKNNWKCPVKKPVLKHIENIKMVSKVPKIKNFPVPGKPKIRSHILALRKEMKLKKPQKAEKYSQVNSKFIKETE